MRSQTQKFRRFAIVGFLCGSVLAGGADVNPGPETPIVLPPAKPSLGMSLLEAVLPKSMQKRPTIFFAALTELTGEGRNRRQPTPENPMYYRLHVAKFVQTGWAVAAGERPPPDEELQAAMQKALATKGYLMAAEPGPQPEVLIILTFGSHGTDPGSLTDDSAEYPPVNAGELVSLVVSDAALFEDVVNRATLIAGPKFATELKAALDGEVRNIRTNRTIGRNPGNQIHAPVSPEFASPFQVFVGMGKNRAVVQQAAEMAFHTCYFVLATAYDYAAAEKGEKRPLWRTRMTVEAQGVAMNEILSPLITNTAPYLGQETSEVAIVKKQIDRSGKVEVGTPTVIEGNVLRGQPTEPAGRR